MRATTGRLVTLAAAGAFLLTIAVRAAEPPIGPATEKRFPPLKLPADFQATLFACDPLIEYPSVIALGPRPGTLYVAIDYMTGLGTEIVRRSEIRILEDTDGDGYADKAHVFAQGFNSIQGMAYHDDAVYVMHAPFLTRLRDTDGDGRADVCHDLLNGLGLPPEKNPVRLHCANGVVAGHDGWLYLALGDHGADVTRPEGDHLVLRGGGILRCRPDGGDLHVFATGLRNIYDVALDDALNVFVRDNENDGGDYKIRVCHSFFGADHGYPYLYNERPAEALPPLADLGLGSSAGGVSYQENQFPPEYRGNLFFGEWGRAVVRYRPIRAGSSFARLKEIEFAAGADHDPYGFKPTDLVVDYDGSLYVADWADGQRPKRGRGRIYRIRHTGPAQRPDRGAPTSVEQDIRRLDSHSLHVRTQGQLTLERRGLEAVDAVIAALENGRLRPRGRGHAIWVLAHVGGAVHLERFFHLVQTDPNASVQVQAVRAIADLADPVLKRHRLAAGPGDAALAVRLGALAAGCEGHVQREIVIALGRLRWSGAPAWLRQWLNTPDQALAHAAQQLLRRSENWPEILKLLDGPDTEATRVIALRALAERPEPVIVDGVIERLTRERLASRRREYADLLTRVYQRSGPQPYWGYRPAPRPANNVSWERTQAIGEALDHILAETDRELRLAILKRMQREKVPIQSATLGHWLEDERQPERVAAILESLREQPTEKVRNLLRRIIREREHSTPNRRAALAAWIAGLNDTGAAGLLDLAEVLEEGPVLADLLRATSQRRALRAEPLLLRCVHAGDPDVRAAAVEALAERHSDAAGGAVHTLLDDRDAQVRRAAALAAGKLGLRLMCEALLKRAQDVDPAVREASLQTLRLLREPRAVPLAVAALNHRTTALAALECIGSLGGMDQLGALLDLAKRDPASEIITRIVQTLTAWRARETVPNSQRQRFDEAVAEIQGAHGMLLRWKTSGPLQPDAAPPPEILERQIPAQWRSLLAANSDAPLVLGKRSAAEKATVWFAATECLLPEPTPVQLLSTSTGKLEMWLNGRTLAAPSEPMPGRYTATLSKGLNRLLIRVSGASGTVNFHVRFRRVSSSAEHERLAQAALTGTGDYERGRQIFMNIEKSQCLKCHRLGDQGERIGPELTGLGSRFSRVYIIESILEPSRTVSPGFQTLGIILKDGRTLSGLMLAETDATLTLADSQGQKHILPKADIEEQRPQSVSTMPDGLEKRLTPNEFADLIAFLARQKESRAP